MGADQVVLGDHAADCDAALAVHALQHGLCNFSTDLRLVTGRIAASQTRQGKCEEFAAFGEIESISMSYFSMSYLWISLAQQH
jgi:hypothetical protein